MNLKKMLLSFATEQQFCRALFCEISLFPWGWGDILLWQVFLVFSHTIYRAESPAQKQTGGRSCMFYNYTTLLICL